MNLSELQSQSVVVMPVALRPEFLALALESLGRAEFCPPIHIFVDDKTPDKSRWEYQYIFDRRPSNLRAEIHQRPNHHDAGSGCWNILTSIKDGYDSGAQYVILIEEDIIVGPDIFPYHWGRMAEGYVVSCGRRCRHFYKRWPNVYTNPGSCLSRPYLDLLVPHVNDVFFKNTGKYMLETFGPVEGIHGMDDGLIRRVLWKNGLADRVIYPPMEEPRCAHVGFEAYENRYDFCRVDMAAPIQDRIENLRRLLNTLKPGDEKDRYHRDLDPIPWQL